MLGALAFNPKMLTNPAAARVEDATQLIFTVGLGAVSLVGIISFTQSGSAVSEQGVGYEFFYIIAAVVGGCFLTGGYGSRFPLMWPIDEC